MVSLALPIADADAFHRRIGPELRAGETISSLQINIGLLCNLACGHCHVDSSPARRGEKDNMPADVADKIIDWVLRHDQIRTIDITGGSPEMSPHFKRMVRAFTADGPSGGRTVMDRCNPTIITHVDRDGTTYDWIPAFLAEHKVEVTCSLPCYLEDNVDSQRGDGSFEASIEGLRRLNAVGYGRDPELTLNLVYNPTGPSLPPPQASLEDDYRRELGERFGLRFTSLFTITNMPIARWRRDLARHGQLDAYVQKLMDAYNPDTIPGLMCRHQIHADHHGRLSDCDFNFAVKLPAELPHADGEAPLLWEVTPEQLAERRIATGDHCYGCTAGAGSSCTGSLTDDEAEASSCSAAQPAATHAAQGRLG
ncbi:MAG: arsenosugar biosynthesis radical SAM (seleno)protein ArsS [Planctomycetota bacterium]